MSDRRVQLGMVLGLAASALFLAARPLPPRDVEPPLPPHGPLLSDCDGALETVVVQYVPEAAAVCQAAYREFLGQLPRDVEVLVVCPARADFEDLRSRVGPVACRLRPVRAGHAVTCWSRDRWLALAPSAPGRPTLLLSPREELGQGAWPQRRGDRRVAGHLAAALPNRVVARRSVLDFDGGDFVADDRYVFVTPDVCRRNVGHAVATASDLRQRLEALLKRPVVLLREAPPYHAGMFLMLAGDGTAVVGDPSLARQVLAEDGPETGLSPSPAACPLAEPDFSPATQRRFDAVAAACAERQYRVVRIPVVPGRDGRTYVTYVNVVLDERDGRRTVYLPTYRGAQRLNEAAAAIWRSLGHRVRQVDCSAAYPHYGSLRCLVNVLRRAPPA